MYKTYLNDGSTSFIVNIFANAKLQTHNNKRVSFIIFICFIMFEFYS